MNWQEAILRLWRPPPTLKVSQWADANRQLSSEASAEPGQWKTDRAPYQRDIMDAVNDPANEIVTWMSSSQVGKTEVLLNVIGYFVENDPSPMLALQPTQKPMAEAFSKDRVATMFRDTPTLTPLLHVKGRDSENTILHKTFPGGHLTIAGANSPASLASRPIRVVLADEIDRYPESAGTEGDPLTLAERRTVTFWNRVKLRTSTPTVDGRSRIQQSFYEGDQRFYYVPCPECSHYQKLQWASLTWDKLDNGDPDLESVTYVCEECETNIKENEKARMVKRGKWVATKPHTGHASFHISALYSPWIAWAEIVQEFYQSKGDYERMKAWTNTLLGEPFKEEAVELDPLQLIRRREDYELLPVDGLVITGAVDVQQDRLELGVMGWGESETSWWLERRVFYGDTSQEQAWEDLFTYLLNKRYETEDGRQLRIAATGVDTGYRPDVCYAFIKTYSKRIRLFAIKGLGGERPIWSPPTYGQRAPVPIYSAGVDPAKDLLFARFQLIGEPGCCHWNLECDEDFFNQLTAEKSQIKMRRGFEVREWVKVRTRNEILDLYVYNLVTLYTLNPDWKALMVVNDDSVLDETESETAQVSPTQQLINQRRGRGVRRKGFVSSWR